MAVLCLDKKKLNQVLASRGLSLNALAKRCGISRQSIYNMFDGESILSKPFEKMLQELNVELNDVLTAADPVDDILGGAPDSIKRAAMALQRYAVDHDADLYLIGSRTRGKTGFRADWDFGIYFAKGQPKNFASTKQRIQDTAFPHRLDVVDLNSAPSWFLRSVADDALHITGTTPRDEIFTRGGPNNRRVA